MSTARSLWTLLYCYEKDPARTERGEVDKTGSGAESITSLDTPSYLAIRGKDRAVRTTQTGIKTRENSAEKRTREFQVI